MAVGLANFLNKLGYTPSILPFQAHDTDVCTTWDSKVVSRSKSDFTRWSEKCSHIIWIGGISKKKIEAAKAAGVRNILLIRVQDIAEYRPDVISLFDLTICPTIYMANVMSEIYPDFNIMPVPWDPGIPIVNKKPSVSEDIRVYVPIQSAAAARYGARVLYSLSLLLEQHAATHVTIARNKRWSREALTELYALKKKNPLRVEIQVKPTMQERLTAYGSHHWTFYPYYMDDHLCVPMESLYSGAPVITLRSPFSCESIKSHHNGFVIRTTPSYHEGFKIAMDPTPTELSDILLSVIPNKKILRTLQEKPWPELEARRRAFQAAWPVILS